MKTTLRGWNLPYKELSSEKVSLAYLDECNKTRYSRRKNQEGLLEIASREAHEKKKTYYATILQEDDTPYCAIRADGGYFGIDFLRDRLDEYLTYIYRDEYSSDGRLFLKTILLSDFEHGTEEKIKRIDFIWLPDGSFGIITYQGEAYNGTFQRLEEVQDPLSEEEVKLLWADYPEFGNYEELIRLDRIPQRALEIVLEVTDREFPHFRDHLQRDIEKYQAD